MILPIIGSQYKNINFTEISFSPLQMSTFCLNCENQFSIVVALRLAYYFH